MEADVPSGRFVGHGLLGFGGAKVCHVSNIAHMVGVFKVGRKIRLKVGGLFPWGAVFGLFWRALVLFKGVDVAGPGHEMSASLSDWHWLQEDNLMVAMYHL